MAQVEPSSSSSQQADGNTGLAKSKTGGAPSLDKIPHDHDVYNKQQLPWASPQVFHWEGDLPKVSYCNPPSDLLPILTGPVEMEYLTWTGIIMFLDGLLYCLTFLPLKTIAALRDICIGHRQEKATLYPKQLYVLVQATVIIVSTAFVDALTMTEAYGFVVNLSWTRTWVLYSLFDVFDEILTKFGQRTMGSLLWCIKERRELVPAMTVLCVVYVSAHSFAMNLKISTIHIAIDRGNMLFALLLALKIPELKGGSLLQCTKSTLFRLCLTDTVDRSKCVVFSCLIFLDKAARFPLDRWAEWMPTLFGATVMIFASEVLVDWLKHAGLVMVNSEWLSSTVYADFRRAICQDLVRNTQEDPTGLADCTVSVMSDNFGFVQLPLTCLILNMVWAMELQAVETGGAHHATFLLVAFASLFALKLVTHHFLLSYALAAPAMPDKSDSAFHVRADPTGMDSAAASPRTPISSPVQSFSPIESIDEPHSPNPAAPADADADENAALADSEPCDGLDAQTTMFRRRSSSDLPAMDLSRTTSKSTLSPATERTKLLRKTTSMSSVGDTRHTQSTMRRLRVSKSLSAPQNLHATPCKAHSVPKCRLCKTRNHGGALSLSSIVLDVLSEKESGWSDGESSSFAGT